MIKGTERWLIGICLMLLLGSGVLLTRGFGPSQSTDIPSDRPDAPTTNISASDNLQVHVAGAVRYPGVYAVPRGSRANAAIELAGGPLSQADLDRTNLAAKLRDGQRVSVHFRKPEKWGKITTPKKTPLSANSPQAGFINLNTASATDLSMLPGVGRAKAEEIVRWRVRLGPFGSVADLDHVKGFGPSLRHRIEPFITVN